ncbi:MAG: ABC transporter permease subunit [Chloroflexota bacterium]
MAQNTPPPDLPQAIGGREGSPPPNLSTPNPSGTRFGGGTADSSFRLDGRNAWFAFFGGIVILLVLAQFVDLLDLFPESWNLGLREVLNEFKRWVVVNRTTHPIFLFFFEPLSDGIDFGIRRFEGLLLWLPWPIVIIVFFLLGERIGGLRLALGTVVCLLPMGLFGLWEESMQTLSLMVTAVVIALVVGVPIGIWTARSQRAEQILRPILDAMQTMPAFVYLIPVLLFFGVARVPSVIATIIYALPPIIRLTNLGLRTVPEEVMEAAHAFGVTRRQLLRKVQLPLALPTIMVGVNQTIMMALSIVVIAALIGAGGLGDVVLKALRRLRVGEALEAGLAIVLMAILLDRLSLALSKVERRSQPHFQGFRLFGEQWRGNVLAEQVENAIERAYIACGRGLDRIKSLLPQRLQVAWLLLVLILLVTSTLLRLVGVLAFPQWLDVDLAKPVDAMVKWMQVNLYDIGDSGFGTGPFRDFLIINVFKPLQRFLTEVVPWTVVLFAFVAAGYRAGGWRLALSVLLLVGLIGFFGMWPFAMDTLGQTLVAVLLCVLVGIPLGVWAAHNDMVEQILRPILDFLQTIPIFVYLVPVIMLFGTGSVAGLIASLLYAVVPVIRLTSAGIRNVDETVQESAAAFGATSFQKLRKIEVPLALPSIMLGINQTIMMALAMVIIAGLVGATGLGLEVYQGFANDNLGRSVEAGLAIVLMAIVIDRITQQLAKRASESANIG